MLRNPKIPLLACCFFALASCENIKTGSSPWTASSEPTSGPVTLGENIEDVDGTKTVQQPGTMKYFRSDQALKMAVEQFSRGNYALAEGLFRDAAEMAPKDPAAWIGLAGAYDRTGRFDLADQAYRRAIALVGETPQILNNQGYSYMLRSDLRTARAKFELAYKKDPTNRFILNNIELLNGSYAFIKRDGETDAIQTP